MSLLTATRVAELVGEMEVPACEHSQHTKEPTMHGDGPATHYVRGTHSCREATEAYAACEKLVAVIRANIFMGCSHCSSVTTTGRAFEILGPVNK